LKNSCNHDVYPEETEDIIIMDGNQWKRRDGLTAYDMNKIEIKYCKYCGLVKRLPYKYFNCPECDMPDMFFFINIGHLIKNVDMYGLGNKRIVEGDLIEEILKAFREPEAG
jgi:hypothetical protein